MSLETSGPDHRWTVAEAKARLSEILRLADEEGPQRIGVRRTFVVMSERMWRRHAPAREPLGRWLVENLPRGVDLDVPAERGSSRGIPFVSEDSE